MDNYTIRIERLQNGFKVEVPDMAEIAKKKAERAKDKMSPIGYYGDCTKSFAAKNVAEVTKLVKDALSALPEQEYDAAFDKAAGGK